MNDQDLRQRLRDVFVTAFEDPDFEMEPAVKMGDIDEWDSFNHINLMLGIESEFGVEFDSDEIGTLLSVGQIFEALERRLGAVGP
jgi:acyl carrier protein